MRREFHFKEGSSNKFWAIELDGKTFYVHFGKEGTSGQKQEKAFKSTDAAQEAHDKLIAEKVKKGYVERGKKKANGSANLAAISDAEPKAKRAAEEEAPAVRTDTKREILLRDVDWMWAGKIPAPSKPAAVPFDKDSCLARLAKMKTRRYGYDWDFASAGITAGISKEEARFWLECMHKIERDVPPKKRAELLAKKKLGEASDKMIKEAIGNGTCEELALVLTVLSSPMEVTEKLIAGRPGTDGYDGAGAFFRGYREHVFPRLTDAERDALRKRIRPNVAVAKFPTDFYETPDANFLLAVLLGMHDEMKTLVTSWPDNHFLGEDWNDAYHTPQLFVLGLGNAKLISEQMRRMKLRLRISDYMRGWLATTEYSDLDWAAKTIAEEKNRETALELAQILAVVRAPENAGPMLEVATKSKAPKVGIEWLEQNVGHAAAGLVEVAAGRGGLASAAEERLRTMKRGGFGDLIEGALKGASTEAKTKVKTNVIDKKEKLLTPLDKAPRWLEQALGAAKSAKPVKWVQPKDLPVLEVDGKALTTDHVSTLLSALSASTLEKPNTLVSAIAEHAEASSRDAFGWKLFEPWLGEGAPSKEKWALFSVGLFGGDESALKLAPMVRAWPGESQHARAVIGLDCLGAIGTDVALMQLSGIAQKVKFRALKERAGKCMEGIAKTRKMSRDDLEDRIVPDGGFDAEGKRALSFGSRSFNVVLNSDGSLAVKDDAGKKLSDLPKPGKSDDADKAKQAQDEWKLLKKTLREATKIQIERLEQTMVKGRSWNAKAFDELLVKHPLMGHLVRGLLFGSYSAKGKLEKTFRVAEDGTLADDKDSAFKLAKDADIRIVHPLELKDPQKATWGQVFSDYELMPVFEQLGRPVFVLEKKEAKQKDLAPRFKGKEWGVSAFVGRLERRGWLRGQPQDAGLVYEHAKPFYGTKLSAVINYTGYPVGDRQWADKQAIEKVFFIKGTEWPVWVKKNMEISLGDVDPIALSEVLYDLSLLD